jgi:hypothetical protein
MAKNADYRLRRLPARWVHPVPSGGFLSTPRAEGGHFLQFVFLIKGGKEITTALVASPAV